MFNNRNKIKKILSVVLIFAIVFSTATIAFAAYPRYQSFSVVQDNKTYYYHTDGTIFERDGTSGVGGNGRLNAKLTYSDNRFMLVEDNQKFVFTQVLWLQQEYQLSAEKISFYSLDLYHDGTVFEDESADALVENRPAAGEVKTDDMLNNHNLKVSFEPIADENGKENSKEIWDEWKANNPDSTAMFPSFDMSSVMLSVGGNKQYFFKSTCSFTANDALESNFYYEMYWQRDVPRHTLVPVNIQITDAREVVKKAAEYEAIIANPEGYTAEQVAQYHKYLEGIPEGMLDGSKYYTPEQVSTVYDFITGKISGYANIEEYVFYRDKANELIKKDSEGNYVHSDIYTKESLQSFENAFYEADVTPVLPLPESKQNLVDSATNVIKTSIKSLENSYIKDQTSNDSVNDTVWDSSVDTPLGDNKNPYTKFKITNTDYKFIQTKDGQNFTFPQELFGTAVDVTNDSVKPVMTQFVFDEAVCQNSVNCNLNENSGVKNNTTEFLKHLSSANKSTVSSVTAYKGWSGGSEDKSFNITDGVIASTELTGKKATFGNTFNIYGYGAKANITISGNPVTLKSDGSRKNIKETDLSFYWKLTSSYNGVEYHAHIPVSIQISDIRAITELYDELSLFVGLSKNVDERNKYTAESVTAIENALSSIPENLILGTKFYTQDQINSYYDLLYNTKDSLVAKNKADATQYNEIFKEVSGILEKGNSDGRYNDSAWNNFVNGVTNVTETIGKTEKFTEDEQGKLNTAASSLTDLKTELMNNRYVFVVFKDENGAELTKIKVFDKSTVAFSSLTGVPNLPADIIDNQKYIGWEFENGTLIKGNYIITEDVILTRSLEKMKIIAKTNANIVIDDVDNLISGLNVGTRVAELLNQLDNDSSYIKVTSFDNEVTNQAVVATGMKLELISKSDGSVLDTAEVVIKGDVTGDGIIDDEDYNMAAMVCTDKYNYDDWEKAFSAANDIDGDGVFDVIDLFLISNMCYN